MRISKDHTSDPRQIVLNYSLSLTNNDDVYGVRFSMLEDHANQMAGFVAAYSSAIGICLLVSIVLWVVTQNKRTPVFVLNQLSLNFMVIRSSLYLVHLNGPLSSLSFTFTGIFTPEYQKYCRVVLAANAFEVILITCILCSMTYQIYIIFKSPEVMKLGIILTVFMSMVNTGIVGLYINNAVVSSKVYYNLSNNDARTVRTGSWVTDIPFALFSASVISTCVMLICKLVCAIRSRRYLGLRQFDVFHILLVMSTQTLIVPSILTLINFGVSAFLRNLLVVISILLIVISLPLSSMWASTANNGPMASSASLSFLSRCTSSVSDILSDCSEQKFSLMPRKLSKLTSRTPSSLSRNLLPTTLTSVTDMGLNSIPKLGTPSPSSLPSNIEQIIKEEMNIGVESTHEYLDSTPRRDSFDRIIDQVKEGEFISITSHNVHGSPMEDIPAHRL